MAKFTSKSFFSVDHQIFDDLEKFLEFCQNYGYRYNEADLYNWKSYAYQQFSKFVQGKNVKDMWDQDTKPLYRTRTL